VTIRFQVLYVFVAMEPGSRRIMHYNVTAHPTAEWTRRQFREAIPSDHCYQFLVHDRDSIFSREMDQANAWSARCGASVGADGELGGPRLSAQMSRSFPLLSDSCIPSGLNPSAYSLNFTVIPNPSGQPLSYPRQHYTGKPE